MGASKQGRRIRSTIKFRLETFRPEERDSGAVIRESHLDNVLGDGIGLLATDVAMEALEEMKEIIKKRLIVWS